MIWIAAILFILGLLGASFSFWLVGKKKNESKKNGVAVAASIAFGLMAMLAAFYLVSAVLFLGSID